MHRPPLIVIVGPTASGKTSLSIKIAQQFSGEVISADSRQVYRGLDIGSGKVTVAEMAGVPHHLLDVTDPMTVYTASDFKRDAASALTHITQHGNLPIIAGGTFFYVDTLLGDISFPQIAPNETLRAELHKLSNEALLAHLHTLDPIRANNIDPHNPRRLIRAIEIATAIGTVPLPQTADLPYHVLKLGINIDKETLHHNIHVRLHERLRDGMLEEVERLLTQGVTHERLESLGLEYRYLSRYIRKLFSYDEMVLELETKIRQFAKRQYTWLKRDKSIIWVHPKDHEAVTVLVADFVQHPSPK